MLWLFTGVFNVVARYVHILLTILSYASAGLHIMIDEMIRFVMICTWDFRSSSCLYGIQRTQVEKVRADELSLETHLTIGEEWPYYDLEHHWCNQFCNIGASEIAGNMERFGSICGGCNRLPKRTKNMILAALTSKYAVTPVIDISHKGRNILDACTDADAILPWSIWWIVREFIMAISVPRWFHLEDGANHDWIQVVEWCL